MDGQRPTFHSIPLRRHRPAQPMNTTVQTRTRQAPNQSYVSHTVMPPMQDDDQLYMTRATPTSAIRYTDSYEREVFQQGNRRVVLKHVRAKRRVYWLFSAGLGMLAMLILMFGGMWGVNAWDNHQLDATYGFPRYWQTDQVLGLSHDSPTHKTHLIFQNLQGQVVMVVIPAGDISKARIYSITTLLGPDAVSTPITADFKDVNGDGRIDIIVKLGDQGSIVLLNDGTGFKPQTQQ